MPGEPFLFPRGMSKEEAERLLAQAYHEIDEGKLLRRTNKTLRRKGIDPPMDVQYVAEPIVVEYMEGLGIDLGCNIMIYEEFPELGDCVRAFESTLHELLQDRLSKHLKTWAKRRPRGAA